jgi:hypothetical protein
MANFVMHIKKMVLAEVPSNWEMMWKDIEAFIE